MVEAVIAKCPSTGQGWAGNGSRAGERWRSISFTRLVPIVGTVLLLRAFPGGSVPRAPSLSDGALLALRRIGSTQIALLITCPGRRTVPQHSVHASFDDANNEANRVGQNVPLLSEAFCRDSGQLRTLQREAVASSEIKRRSMKATRCAWKLSRESHRLLSVTAQLHLIQHRARSRTRMVDDKRTGCCSAV